MKKYFVQTEKPKELLSEIIAGLDSGRISFEGWIKDKKLNLPAPDSESEDEILKRNTVSPNLDFLVYEIDSTGKSSIEHILEVLSPYFNDEHGVIHVQVEHKGVLHLGAYDNFDPECIVMCASEKSLMKLSRKGLLNDGNKFST